MCLLNKEQVVDHDGKGDDIDGAAAECGKREHGLEERGCRGNDTELKCAVYLRRLVGALDTGDACGKVDEALNNHHNSGECGVRSVSGSKIAGNNAGNSDDEAGDAQNKINQGKDFECLASGAHSWSFRCGRGESVAPRLRHIS